MKLHEKLKAPMKYPFHMPGHKRNKKFNITGSEIDITETEGFDNLHAPVGVIKDTEDRLQKIYKSKKSYMLVNGSTVGILAAIFAVCKEGDKIIIARNCHKSVYNACMLRKLRIIYIEPEYDIYDGYYTRVSQDSLNSVIAQNKDAKAVVITSPTYEGRISDIKCDIPLIIDAAHGAHLGIYLFPNYPKGSIVVSSLHKTLPALTQCAVMNVYDEKYIKSAKFYLDIFETSSPSYVLMNSVSICCDIVENHQEYFKEYYKNLCDFRVIDLEHLSLKYCEDISKIVISTSGTEISGEGLADILRKMYNIEPEASSLNYVILMTSVGDEKEAFVTLKEALLEIDGELGYVKAEPIKKPPVNNWENIIRISENGKETLLLDSPGKVANEFVFAYPPDIPIIVPGEAITKEVIEYIIAMNGAGVNLLSDSNLLPDKILTKGE